MDVSGPLIRYHDVVVFMDSGTQYDIEPKIVQSIAQKVFLIFGKHCRGPNCHVELCISLTNIMSSFGVPLGFRVSGYFRWPAQNLLLSVLLE